MSIVLLAEDKTFEVDINLGYDDEDNEIVESIIFQNVDDDEEFELEASKVLDSPDEAFEELVAFFDLDISESKDGYDSEIALKVERFKKENYEFRIEVNGDYVRFTLDGRETVYWSSESFSDSEESVFDAFAGAFTAILEDE